MPVCSMHSSGSKTGLIFWHFQHCNKINRHSGKDYYNKGRKLRSVWPGQQSKLSHVAITNGIGLNTFWWMLHL